MSAALAITHPGKVFWPAEGYTKLDLARYYEAIFPRLRPFVNDRLLALERCPDGMCGECFFQKEAPKGLPNGTQTKLIHHQSRAVHYVVGGLLETQIAIVNLGCIAVHLWGSRAEHPHQPDWIVFDLDPSSGEFSDAAKAGQLVRAGLEALGITSFPKTSGRGTSRLRTNPNRTRLQRGPVLCRGLRQAPGGRPPRHTDSRAAAQAPRESRLPRSVPQRFWRNRGGALLRTPARESPLFDASPLGGCESVRHALGLQSGQLRGVPRGS